MKARSNRYDVFISYSAHDRAWTRRFAHSLKHQGLTVWLAEEQIGPGDAIAEEIMRGLRQSGSFISVVSPSTLERPNTLIEIGTAIGMDKDVVLIVPQDVKPEWLPLKLQDAILVKKETPASTAEKLVRARFAGGESRPG